MTIIEVDGVAHQPLTVDSLNIFAGQRYSVVIEASQTADNYCMNPRQSMLCAIFNDTNFLGIRANPSTGTTGFTGGINSAILRYDGAAIADPTTSATVGGTVLNEANLIVRIWRYRQSSCMAEPEMCFDSPSTIPAQ